MSLRRIVRIVREVLSEVFETTHSLNRVRDRIMDKIYFTVGYEDNKSPLGYVIVGKYHMRDNIRARIMNNLDTIKDYDYSTNVEYAIKIGYVEVDRRDVKFINDELRVNSLGKMLFVIDEETKSIGRDIYAIIANNTIITIMFNNNSNRFRSQKKIIVTNPRELGYYHGVTPVVKRSSIDDIENSMQVGSEKSTANAKQNANKEAHIKTMSIDNFMSTSSLSVGHKNIVVGSIPLSNQIRDKIKMNAIEINRYEYLDDKTYLIKIATLKNINDNLVINNLGKAPISKNLMVVNNNLGWLGNDIFIVVRNGRVDGVLFGVLDKMNDNKEFDGVFEGRTQFIAAMQKK